MRPSVITLVVILATISANAQAPKSGQPDLQGLWTNDTATPLERPKQFAGKAVFDASEEAAFEAAVRESRRALIPDADVTTSGDVGYTEPGQMMRDRRTSLIVDPPNGALPPLLPAARQRVNESVERKREYVADDPEDFDISERCIAWPSPPMQPLPFNAQLQIVQTPDYVVIHTEQFGEVRVVPLDGRPHLPSDMRQWKGDSRGRWENDTLIVETTNFRQQRVYANPNPIKGVDESLRVIERFSLTGRDTILYRFTVDDPTAYASAWTAETLFTRATKPMFEFACHEGNYSLKNNLLGARAVEQRKATDPQ